MSLALVWLCGFCWFVLCWSLQQNQKALKLQEGRFLAKIVWILPLFQPPTHTHTHTSCCTSHLHVIWILSSGLVKLVMVRLNELAFACVCVSLCTFVCLCFMHICVCVSTLVQACLTHLEVSAITNHSWR